MWTLLLTNRKAILSGILAGLVGIWLGYAVGHWAGFDDGETHEKSVQLVTGATETIKATTQREGIDNAVRKIPDTQLDHELSAGGWLRDNASDR